MKSFYKFYEEMLLKELAPAPQMPGVQAAPAPQVPAANPPGQGTSPPVPPVDPNFTDAVKKLTLAAQKDPKLQGPYQAFMKQLQGLGIAQNQPQQNQPQQPQKIQAPGQGMTNQVAQPPQPQAS